MKSKWVFKNKSNGNSNFERWKARCIVKGYTQHKGTDYQEKFTPTPKTETDRTLLAFKHQIGWYKKQGDGSTAFLNPDPNIDLYMDIP